MSTRVFLVVAVVAVACSSDETPKSDHPNTGGASGSARGGASGAGAASGGAGRSGSGGTNNDAGGGTSGMAGTAAVGGSDAGFDSPVGNEVAFVYTGSGNGTISIFRMDRTTGALTPSGSAAGGANPSFLAWDPAHKYLFAVNEGTPGKVVAFSINQTSGALSKLNEQPSAGNGPANVSVDGLGKWLFVANYAGGAEGTVAVLPILTDGALGPYVDMESFGTDSNPHLITTDPANKFVFVPCKGRDFVAQFAFLSASGSLTPNVPPTVAFAAGSGPRHMAFHPSSRFAYVVGELNSTLTALAYNVVSGTLSVLETESMLPTNFTGTNSGADVHVHPNGNYVYASNRGHNSIAIFSIDGQGRLTAIGHRATGGTTPRNFHIDPTGTFLLVANQGSGTVVSFRIDSNGQLTPTTNSVNVNAPAFVGVVTQPG